MALSGLYRFDLDQLKIMRDIKLASVIQETPQLLAPAWVLELAQRLGFNPADSLALRPKLLPQFFQRMISVHADAKAHTHRTLFTRRERSQNPCCRLTQDFY